MADLYTTQLRLNFVTTSLTLIPPSTPCNPINQYKVHPNLFSLALLIRNIKPNPFWLVSCALVAESVLLPIFFRSRSSSCWNHKDHPFIVSLFKKAVSADATRATVRHPLPPPLPLPTPLISPTQPPNRHLQTHPQPFSYAQPLPRTLALSMLRFSTLANAEKHQKLLYSRELRGCLERCWGLFGRSTDVLVILKQAGWHQTLRYAEIFS